MDESGLPEYLWVKRYSNGLLVARERVEPEEVEDDFVEYVRVDRASSSREESVDEMQARQRKVEVNKSVGVADQLKDIHEERGNSYGAFSVQAAVSQEIKASLLRYGLGEQFKAMNENDQKVVFEAMDMIAVKLSRVIRGDPLKKDTWDDIAGYALLVPRHTTGAPF
jgi:hypothetical protein